MARSRGGRRVPSASNRVDYMVVEKDPGSKSDEAKERGIVIIHENIFIEMTD